MTALLAAAHILAAVAIAVSGHRLGRGALVLSALPLLAALGVVAWHVPSVLDGSEPFERGDWVGSLGLGFSFRLDGLAMLMALVVGVIGVLVLVYACGYFAAEPPHRLARFAAWFCLFAGAMLGLVTAADVWTLFTCWELTSVTSFVLIGLDDHRAAARTAAQRALLVTSAGGLAMLGGLACLVHEAGTSDLRVLLAAAPTSTTAQLGLVLVLIGAFAKSAQFPLHFWLPGAMAAPTPVSAYLHSATMVKAGVLVVARFSPAFATLGWWRPLLVVVGGSTMLIAGVAALRRSDAKLALAFGTVSQLGLLTTLFGVGSHAATAAGVALLMSHVLFKAALFLAIGAVEHATGSRDLDRLSAVGRSTPLLAAAAALCTASMIGLPPLVGFAAKEAALASLVDGVGGWMAVALVAVTLGSMLTVAYSVRIWWGLFATKPGVVDAVTVHHRPTTALTAPVVALALASLAAGLGAPAVGRRLDVAARSLDGDVHLHLTLWPGAHLPVLLSATAVLVGMALALALQRVRLRRRPAVATLGERSFGRAYGGLIDGARRLTLVTQSGSLPVYVAVVFGVLGAVVAAALIRGDGDLGDPVVADSVLQGVIALLAVAMCLAVVMARRRFVAVLLLGGVGQALTLLFLMYGAPDLALTQFMVETLMIVAFVLVLRHLPREYAPSPTWAPRALRLAIAVFVGVTLSLFALMAGSIDRPTDVQDAVARLSLPAAGGRNVVNVTIVDFRGIDTMFEITVFGIAALGVANLVAASRRNVGYRASTRPARIGAESMVFEQVTRIIFHTTLLVSVFVMLRGHNAPGGGFAGGLIAGAAFVFRLLAGGEPDRSRVTRLSPVALISTGILLAAGTGVAALTVGNEFLETSIYHVHPPLIGDVKLVSAAVFDLGVYLLVIGVVILVLSNLASRTHSGGALRDGVPR